MLLVLDEKSRFPGSSLEEVRRDEKGRAGSFFSSEVEVFRSRNPGSFFSGSSVRCEGRDGMVNVLVVDFASSAGCDVRELNLEVIGSSFFNSTFLPIDEGVSGCLMSFFSSVLLDMLEGRSGLLLILVFVLLSKEGLCGPGRGGPAGSFLVGWGLFWVSGSESDPDSDSDDSFLLLLVGSLFFVPFASARAPLTAARFG